MNSETKFWDLVARSDVIALTPKAQTVADELAAFVASAFGGQGEEEDVQAFKRFFGFDRPDALTRWRRGLFGGVGHDERP